MKIVINRSDAIGDTLLTLPMAKKLKKHFPSCHITFIVSPKTAPVLIGNPIVDDYWVYDKQVSALKNISNLREKFSKEKIDTYFHVGGGHLPSLAALMAGIRYRGGLLNKWQTFFLLNKGVRQRRSLVEMHESEYNINLLQPLGIDYHYSERESCAPEILFQKEEKQKALDDFQKEVEKEKILFKNEMIFIHPGMTGHTLNWSSKNYARLILKLEKSFPDRFLFVLSFTQSDKRYIDGVRKELGQKSFACLEDKVFHFDGGLKGLRNYMAVLSNADLFVGPSTGTTHLANVLGVKIVTIYSPIKVQTSLRWGPFFRDTETVRVVVPDVVCGEKFQCAGTSCLYYECMEKVEVDEVFESAKQLMNNEKV